MATIYIHMQVSGMTYDEPCKHTKYTCVTGIPVACILAVPT